MSEETTQEMSTRKPPRGRGRPVGSQTQEKPIVAVQLSRCPDCGSTERAKYSNRCEKELSGQTPDGKPFSRVIWRHTKCLTCGASRIDKFFEFDGQERLWQSAAEVFGS